MKFTNEKIVSSQAMNVNFASIPILLDQLYGANLQAVYTGSPNGFFKLQASNDDVPLSNSVSNWTDIVGSTQLISTSGSIMWNLNGAFYRWIRIVWTVTSGNGSCDVTIFGKGS
jgi:hypothetical protein